MGRTRYWGWLGMVAALSALQATAVAQATVAAATEAELQQARDAFQAGKGAFDQARYDEALQQFELADRAVASPNTKLMIARCLARLERPADAYTMLQSAMREAHSHADGRYDQAARAAAQEQSELASRIALLTVDIEDPSGEATLTVARRDIARAAWVDPIAIDPGEFEVVLTGSGGQSDRHRLALAPGAAATLHLALDAAGAPPAPPITHETTAPEPEPRAPALTTSTARGPAPVPLRTWGYVAGGAGIAAIAGFAVLGALSNADFAELEEQCPDRTDCADSLADTAERGRTYQTLANVSLAVGVAALGAGAALWILGAPDDGLEVAIGTSGVRVRGEL